MEQTQQVAAALADQVQAGDLVLLLGDLGAGKTAFVKGFGAQLGVTEPITSPTFTLAQQYQGEHLGIHHLDVYRLDQLEEVIGLGIDELLDDDAVTIIEWGDAIVPMLPANYLELRIGFGKGDDDRVLEFSSVGPAWAAREPQLGAALGKVAPSC